MFQLILKAYQESGGDVRFGSLADILRCGADVRFTPEAVIDRPRTAQPAAADVSYRLSLPKRLRLQLV